jgi:hypothetical protein
MKETKRWYKSGHSLLKEIRDTKTGPDTVFLWFLGQHGFVIKLNNKILYIDVLLNDITGRRGESRRCYPPPFPPEASRPVDSRVWFNTPELCSGSNNAILTKIWY